MVAEQRRLEWAETQRHEAVRREVQQQAAEVARLLRERVRRLDEQVEMWEHATRIRRFVVAARSGSVAGAVSDEWLDWATSYADSIDPVVAAAAPGSGATELDDVDVESGGEIDVLVDDAACCGRRSGEREGGPAMGVVETVALEPGGEFGGGTDVVPVQDGSADAGTEVGAVAAAGVPVLQFDRPRPAGVVGEEGVEVAGWAGDVAPQCGELRGAQHMVVGRDCKTEGESGAGGQGESTAEHVCFESVFGLPMVEHATGSVGEGGDEFADGVHDLVES